MSVQAVVVGAVLGVVAVSGPWCRSDGGRFDGGGGGLESGLEGGSDPVFRRFLDAVFQRFLAIVQSLY